MSNTASKKKKPSGLYSSTPRGRANFNRWWKSPITAKDLIDIKR